MKRFLIPVLAVLISLSFSCQLNAQKDKKGKTVKIKIEKEVDRLTATEGYEDFWDHKEAIFKVAEKNPNLSLQQAYDLAVTKDEKKTNAESNKTEKKTASLRHLPERVPVSEKPSGMTNDSTTEANLKGKKAAERAFEDLFEGGET